MNTIIDFTQLYTIFFFSCAKNISKEGGVVPASAMSRSKTFVQYKAGKLQSHSAAISVNLNTVALMR